MCRYILCVSYTGTFSYALFYALLIAMAILVAISFYVSIYLGVRNSRLSRRMILGPSRAITARVAPDPILVQAEPGNGMAHMAVVNGNQVTFYYVNDFISTWTTGFAYFPSSPNRRCRRTFQRRAKGDPGQHGRSGQFPDHMEPNGCGFHWWSSQQDAQLGHTLCGTAGTQQ